MLKNTCAAAALLAATLPDKAAKIAVIVVPILSPNNTDKAAVNSIAPSEYNPCTIQIVVLEHSTINVKTAPTKTPHIPFSDILNVNSWNTSKLLKGPIPLLIKPKPKNKDPKPKIV